MKEKNVKIDEVTRFYNKWSKNIWKTIKYNFCNKIWLLAWKVDGMTIDNSEKEN